MNAAGFEHRDEPMVVEGTPQWVFKDSEMDQERVLERRLGERRLRIGV